MMEPDEQFPEAAFQLSENAGMETADGAAASAVPFEDMTLADAIGQFVRAPAATWKSLLEVVKAAPRTEPPANDIKPSLQTFFSTDQMPARAAAPAVIPQADRQRDALALGLRLCALIGAFWGSSILATLRTEAEGLAGGGPILLAAGLFWFAADLYFGN